MVLAVWLPALSQCGSAMRTGASPPPARRLMFGGWLCHHCASTSHTHSGSAASVDVALPADAVHLRERWEGPVRPPGNSLPVRRRPDAPPLTLVWCGVGGGSVAVHICGRWPRRVSVLPELPASQASHVWLDRSFLPSHQVHFLASPTFSPPHTGRFGVDPLPWSLTFTSG